MKESFSSPQEQLDIITSLVQDSREGLRENAFPYVVWGGAASAGTAVSFLLDGLGCGRFIGPFWIVTSVLAQMSIMLYYRKQNRLFGKRALRLSSRVYAALWGGLVAGGASLIAASLIAGNPFTLSESLAIIGTLIGIGYITSSVLTRYRLLAVLGALWITGACATLALPDRIAPLLTGAMAFLFEFVPGLGMYLRGNEKERP